MGKISEMTNATTPLNDADLVPVVQAGNSRKASIQDVRGFETGSWTPTFLVGGSQGTTTYLIQSGLYVKHARLVFAQFYVSVDSLDGTLTGKIEVGGLPYVPTATASNVEGGGSLNVWDGFSFSWGHPSAPVVRTSNLNNRITFLRPSTTGTTVNLQTGASDDLGGTSPVLGGSVTFITD